jgi:hypothetical protein
VRSRIFDIDDLEHLLDVYVKVLEGKTLEGRYKRKEDVSENNET